jgi:hypothetical protein
MRRKDRFDQMPDIRERAMSRDQTVEINKANALLQLVANAIGGIALADKPE